MTTFDIAQPRATVNDSADGLEIAIPAPRVWLAVLFLGFWLFGWATGEAFAIRQLFGPGPTEARMFLAVWLAGWTLGGGAALAACAWMLAGKERVRLLPDVLAIRRDVLGLGFTKPYPLDRVRNLRAQALPEIPPGLANPQALAGVKTAMRLVGVLGPGIAFDCDGRSVRFGFAIDLVEAQQLVTLLKARHAFA
ncbi:MAG: hypothetical protein HZC42_14445 [Candidatus Eisenbacteria bacterium]|nr:hypothetical protein [Candidatus Eisenbacteria bacterium]